MQWKQVINCLICLLAALQTQQKPTDWRTTEQISVTKVLDSLLAYWYESMAKISTQQSRHHQQCLNHFLGAWANISLSVLLCSWLWWQTQTGWLGSRDRDTAVGFWFEVGLWSLLTTWTPGLSLWKNEELTMDLHVVVLRPSSHCNSRKPTINAKANSLLISYCQSLCSHSTYFQHATLSKYLFHPEQCMCIFSPSSDLFKWLPAWSVLVIVYLWWHNSTHGAVLQTDRHLTARNISIPH